LSYASFVRPYVMFYVSYGMHYVWTMFDITMFRCWMRMSVW